MPRTLGINCIILVLASLSFLNYTGAFYEVINVKIRNGDEIINLNWRRTEQYLANTNLPVWITQRKQQPNLVPNAFEKLGDFLAYQDIEKSSAVIFLKKYKCFYGIIDTRFYVSHLPLIDPNLDIYYEVGANYVFARENDPTDQSFHSNPDTMVPHLFTDEELQYINSLIDSARMEMDPSSYSQLLHQDHSYQQYPPSTPVRVQPSANQENIDPNNAGSHPTKPIILYPEILVFITRDISNTFGDLQQEGVTTKLLLYYLTYFNAIDMLFGKLATDEITIHINIAGLVIENEPRIFPHCTQVYTDRNTCARSECYQSSRVLFSHPAYINRYVNVFPHDSFDFFFISTSYPIRRDGGLIRGDSTPILDIFATRLMNSLHENILGSIIQQGKNLGDYVIATREIATLMGVNSGHSTKGLDIDNDYPCKGIMENCETYCENCLNWSERSRNDIRIYARSNRNHCFLLNYPRSLSPFGQPVFSQFPEDQCMCYNIPRDFLNPFYIMSIPADSCDARMQCSYRRGAPALMPFPIEGTPCGSNKVCWKRKCVEVDQSSNSCSRLRPEPVLESDEDSYES